MHSVLRLLQAPTPYAMDIEFITLRLLPRYMDNTYRGMLFITDEDFTPFKYLFDSLTLQPLTSKFNVDKQNRI
jgi:hypothetical protein